jgi:hypothetical protein
MYTEPWDSAAFPGFIFSSLTRFDRALRTQGSTNLEYHDMSTSNKFDDLAFNDDDSRPTRVPDFERDSNGLSANLDLELPIESLGKELELVVSMEFFDSGKR